MSLRPPTRLPRCFSRPVTRETKRLVRRRRRKDRKDKKRQWRDCFHRVNRRSQRFLVTLRRFCIQWMLVTCIALLLFAGGFAVFSPLFQVQEVRVTRANARLDIEKVQRILAPFFERNLLFLSGREVSRVLRGVLNDVREVKVGKQYPSKLLVYIALDPLYAQLRILDPDMSGRDAGTGSLIDFLTDQGVYIIVPLPGERALPVINLVDWGVRPVNGDALLSPGFLEIMRETERALNEQFGHRTSARTIFLRSREYHLHVENDIDLWFDIRSPLEEQLLRYRTFLRNVDIGSVEDHVDLRLLDRVVYE